MNFIADTNLISELRKPSPAAAVVSFVRGTPRARLFTTVVNFAELRFGVLSLIDPDRVRVIEAWIEETVRPFFAERVFAADEAALTSWRMISNKAQKAGKPAPPADLLVAAIALVNHCAVVTRDAAPFAAAGVPVFNPWTNERHHF